MRNAKEQECEKDIFNIKENNNDGRLLKRGIIVGEKTIPSGLMKVEDKRTEVSKKKEDIKIRGKIMFLILKTTIETGYWERLGK